MKLQSARLIGLLEVTRVYLQSNLMMIIQHNIRFAERIPWIVVWLVVLSVSPFLAVDVVVVVVVVVAEEYSIYSYKMPYSIYIYMYIHDNSPFPLHCRSLLPHSILVGTKHKLMVPVKRFKLLYLLGMCNEQYWTWYFWSI